MPVQVVDTLPDEVWRNPANIYIGESPTVLLGVTRGGIAWDAEKTMGTIEFDGRRSDIQGHDRIVKYGGKLTATIIQLGGTGQLDRLEPGSSSSTGTAPISTTITPADAGAFFAEGAYLADVRAIWDGGAGVFWSLHLFSALVAKYTIKAGADDQVEVDLEFHARTDLTAQANGDAPYEFEKRTAVPT